MSREALGSQGAGVYTCILHLHKVADFQARAFKILHQYIGGAAEIAHNVDTLGGGRIAVGYHGERPSRGIKRLVSRQRSCGVGVVEHHRQGGLLQAVHAALGDNIGHAAGGLFIHYRQPISAHFAGEETTRLDHQAGTECCFILRSNGVCIGTELLQIHGRFLLLIVGNAYAAAEVHIPQRCAQFLTQALGERPTVLIAATKGIGLQRLGAEMDMETLHSDGDGLEQLLQVGQIFLVNAEFGGNARSTAKGKSGIHTDTDGAMLTTLGSQCADA